MHMQKMHIQIARRRLESKTLIASLMDEKRAAHNHVLGGSLMKFHRLIATALAFFATQAFAQTTPAADKHLARNLAANCANCHGTNGKSVAEVPSLAGVPAAVTIQKMKDYRDGKLPATIMHQLAKGYTDEQVALIADYYSKQAK
jgi:cytochrome subunit of sulfide dehydrogenase